MLDIVTCQEGTKVTELCKAHLQHTQAAGPRERSPSLIELESLRIQKQIKVVVQLPGGGNRVVFIQPTMSASNVVSLISEGLGLPPADRNSYGLYEHFHSSERFIPSQTKILDIIAKWEQYGKTMTERNIPTAFSFAFKKRLFLDKDSISPTELEFEFYQVLYCSLITCLLFDRLKLMCTKELSRVAKKTPSSLLLCLIRSLASIIRQIFLRIQ